MNAFSKKFENRCHALELYFVSYNFYRVHKTLGVVSAMAAGLVETVMNMADAVGLTTPMRLRCRWFADHTRKRLMKFQTETSPASSADGLFTRGSVSEGSHVAPPDYRVVDVAKDNAFRHVIFPNL
jgi:hypothetical protein